MATTTPATPSARRPAVAGSGPITTLRSRSGRQWRTAAVSALAAFVLVGEVGQTLPPASAGRMFPVLWWNWVALAVSSVLLGLIAATFVGSCGRRLLGRAGSGSAGAVAAVAMACPVCSPLAIPLLGTGSVLAFLQPDRGWIALAAVAVLGLTLVLRLRGGAACRVGTRIPVS